MGIFFLKGFILIIVVLDKRQMFDYVKSKYVSQIREIQIYLLLVGVETRVHPDIQNMGSGARKTKEEPFMVICKCYILCCF